MHEIHTPSVFDVAAILITLAAALSWINHKFLKLPSTVGLALMGAVASLVVLAVDAATPSFLIGQAVRDFLAGIDFETALMQGMLSFLLFAGALHVDLSDLNEHLRLKSLDDQRVYEPMLFIIGMPLIQHADWDFDFPALKWSVHSRA